MKPRRRVAVLVAAVAAMAGLAVPLASAAQAPVATQAPAPVRMQSSTWGCVGVQLLDLGICISDPLAAQ